MDIESEVVELRMLVDSLKKEIKYRKDENQRIVSILSEITDRDIVFDKTLKVLVKDYRERKDPSVEEIVRCMYG